MDLSKAYDCLPRDLLIAKLAAYGFSINSLCLMYDYLNNRYQRVKIGSIRSSPRKIHVGVPQGSVLGPMLFNIFINDMFLISLDSEICNFADDNTIFSCGNELHEIVTALENDLSILLEWFKCNGMVVNSKKFQLMFLGLKRKQGLRLNIQGSKIVAKEHVKLLGIEIDNKLKFDKYVQTLCQKVNKKTSAFSRLNMYISREQALSICNMVILSNFNYCLLIWLFCNKGANKKIDRTHTRALKILHNDYDSSFQSLLVRSNSFTVHVQNLQKLMTEIYKSLNNMNPSIVWEFHEKKYVAYDLRKKNLCTLPKAKTISYGVESLSFRGSFLWNTLDDNVKQEPTLARFKNKIRNWAGEPCTCRICR